MHKLPKDSVHGKKHRNVSKNIIKLIAIKVIPKCKDVGQMTNDNLINVREEKESIYLT